MRTALCVVFLSLFLSSAIISTAYADSASDYYDNSDSLLASGGSPEDALISIDKAIELNPVEPDYRIRKAMLLFMLGRRDEVMPELDAAVKLDPDNGDAYLMKYQIMTMGGQGGKEAKEAFDNAIAAYDRAIEKSPDRAELYQDKAMAFIAGNRFDAALAALDIATGLDPKNAAAYMFKGSLLSMASRNEEAIAAVDAALTIEPGNVNALHERVSILRELGRHEEALAAIDTLIAKEPENDWYASVKVDLLRKLGRGEEADALVASLPEESRAYMPKNFDEIMKLHEEVSKLKEESRFEEALAIVDRIIELDPGSGFGYPEKGECLSGLGRYDEAIAAFDNAIERSAGFSSVYKGKRDAIEKMHESGEGDRWEYYEKSLEFYDRLIAKSPERRELKNYRWDTLRLLGRSREADELLDAMLADDPGEILGFMENMELYGEAFRAIDRGLVMRPDSAEIYRKKASLLYELDRTQEALDVIDKAIELEPSSEAYSSKADYLEELGLYDAAIEATDSALEGADYLQTYVYQKKGYLLIKAGRYYEAVEALEEAESPYGYNDDAHISLALALQKCGGAENVERADALLAPLANSDDNYTRLDALSLLGRRDEMLSLISDILGDSPCYRQHIQTEPAFERWWDDPEFIAVVGEKEPVKK